MAVTPDIESREPQLRHERAALLVVDMQHDFMPGGALAVPRADELFPMLNHYIAEFENGRALVCFSRDWHPPDHCSFRTAGGRWPVHCVAGTAGAELVHQVRVPKDAIIVSKGTESAREAYSAFEGTGLAHLLRQRGIAELWIAGVATEYCVRATVLDALQAGFDVTVLVDAVRAVEGSPGDGARALEEMLAAGAKAHSWARPRRSARRAAVILPASTDERPG